MATYLENLTTARDNIAAQLANMTANPKPTYNIDGQMVDWTAHFNALLTALKTLEADINSTDPFEIHSTGFS